MRSISTALLILIFLLFGAMLYKACGQGIIHDSIYDGGKDMMPFKIPKFEGFKEEFDEKFGNISMGIKIPIPDSFIKNNMQIFMVDRLDKQTGQHILNIDSIHVIFDKRSLKEFQDNFIHNLEKGSKKEKKSAKKLSKYKQINSRIRNSINCTIQFNTANITVRNCFNVVVSGNIKFGGLTTPLTVKNDTNNLYIFIQNRWFNVNKNKFVNQ